MFKLLLVFLICALFTLVVCKVFRTYGLTAVKVGAKVLGVAAIATALMFVISQF